MGSTERIAGLVRELVGDLDFGFDGVGNQPKSLTALGEEPGSERKQRVD